MDKKIAVVFKILEAIIIVVLFFIVIHLVISPAVSSWDMMIAFAVIVITGLYAGISWKRGMSSGARLLIALSALAGGFWAFNLFRYTGFIGWPMGHPPHLGGYVKLLVFHLALTATMLASVFMVWRIVKPVATVSWGSWKKTSFSSHLKTVLLLSAIGPWILACYQLSFRGISLPGPVAGFILICLLKSFLTGTTEELCYRGVIQPLATAHFGVPLGITLQSCLFAVFHVYLQEAFFSKTCFLAAIMLLGLIFGVVTRRTSGIGWAIVVHVAIGVSIEWWNLS